MIQFNRLLLVAAVAGCIAFGLAQAPQGQERPTFEVASIKPAKSGFPGMGFRNAPGGRFMATNVTARALITMAYKLQPFQLTGGPSWLSTDHYDIEATPEHTADDNAGKQPADFQQQFEVQRLRLQSLLEDRFQLKFHRETKELPVYALVVAKGGPKLQPSEQKGGQRRPMMRMGRGRFESQGVTTAQLADMLSMQTSRKVIDRTGLTGNYDIKLEYTPDQSQGGPGFGGPPGGGPGPGPEGGMGPPPPDPNGPSIFTALQEQLGLKLESQKGPVEIVVIDHVEKPSEN